MNYNAWKVFAYFGPETQLPLTSLLGAVFGIVMIFGREATRVVMGCYRAIPQRIHRRDR